MEKFPVFVIGFMATVVLTSLGGFIDFDELRQAGGAPFKLGIIVGVTKYVVALLVVLLLKQYFM